MDRLRHLSHAARAPAATAGWIGVLLTLAVGCPDSSPRSSPPPGRFVAVSGKRAADASAKFCERSYPAEGAGTRRFSDPPAQPLGTPSAPPPRGWRWLNLWATWCTPCMEEIPLLGRWHRGLAADGLEVTLELWSVDEDGEALRKALEKPLPGQVRWMRSFEDLAPFLENVGIGRDAALPIHLLVDANGLLRCVRVGAVHDEDYGAIKAILGGG